MAISPKDMQEDLAAKPTAFSYAQAAQGKAAPKATSAQPQGREQEPSSWADDAGDADTVIEEAYENGASSASDAPSKPSTQARGSRGAKTTTPDMQSPLSYGSSSTTTKNDESPSPSRLATGSNWEGSTKVDGPAESTSRDDEVGQINDAVDTSRRESATDAAKAFREAPPPPVNFWAQRMQGAKGSRSAPTDPQQTVDSSKPSASVASVEQTNREAPTGHGGRNQQQSADTAIPRASRVRRGTIGRPHAAETVQSTAMPPPAKDEQAWPTPLTAKDDETRKDPKRSGKADEPRVGVASGNPHGKVGWQKIEFTPTVVFPTANIPHGARGVPAGVRGSQTGSVGKRTNRQSIVLGPDTEKSEPAGKSGFASGRRPSSSNSKPHAPTEIPREPRSGPGAAKRRGSVPSGQLVSVAHDRDSNQPRRQPLSAKESQTMDPANINNATTEPMSASRLPGDTNANTSASSRFPGATVDADFERTASADRRKNSQSDAYRGAHEVPYKRGKRTPPEARSRAHSQGFENHPLGMTTTYRGCGRGGRGRGRSDYILPAQARHYGHASLPMLQPPTTAASKPLTTANTHFFAPPTSDRRPYRGTPQRASLPNDGPLGRYAAGMSSPPLFAIHPQQLYEYGTHPMSALPYSPYMEQYMILNAVGQQLSYYFSLENMLKDMFLRKHMDSQGFVLLSLIASFKRIRDLTVDLELLKSICAQSNELEVRVGPDGVGRVRRQTDWDKWVLPMEDRDPSARFDGPADQTQAAFHPQSVSKSTKVSQDGSRHDTPGGFQSSDEQRSTGTLPSPHINGDGGSPSATNYKDLSPSAAAASKLQAEDPSLSFFKKQMQPEEDFPDAQIPTLMLAVKKLGDQQLVRDGHMSIGGSALSNGTLEDGVHAQGTQRSRSLAAGGEKDDETSHHRASATAASPGGAPHRTSTELYWLKGDDSRASELPSNGDTQPYLHVHAQALEARRNVVTEECPTEVQVLYQFWSHFLIRHFNKSMYDEFRQFAYDDLEQRLSDTGMKHLLVYYQEALSNHRVMRDRVARHYVQLVQREDRSKATRPGFEQLRKAWLNGATNIRNRKIVSEHLSLELRAELDK